MNTFAFQDGLEPIDRVFCDLIQRLAPTNDPWIKAAVALLSRVSGQGHVCLDLALAEQQSPDQDLHPFSGRDKPSADAWRQRLLAYPAVGLPGSFKPMILDGRRLYLHRYWQHEHMLGRALLWRCRADDLAMNRRDLEKALALYFPGKDPDQQKAAVLAATRAFVVISGGPGTGKTHTLARIILMLQHLAGANPLRIKLAAPTGKAAARMQESIKAALDQLGAPDTEADIALPEAQTLHRLLGVVPGTGHHRYHADHPLAADVVIVDEASMIDLALMASLVGAMPEKARLIITGDKDQLASVEAGAVLGDICHGLAPDADQPDKETPDENESHGQAARTTPLGHHIVVLRENYRFSTASGLGALSRAINAGNWEDVLGRLTAENDTSLELRPVPHAASLATVLHNEVEKAYGPLAQLTEPRMALEQLNRYKILTVVRQGPFGAQGINPLVEQILRKSGLIPGMPWPKSTWYAGRPVLITRNDYFHNLFNGDMGVTLSHAAGQGRDEELKVAFADSRGNTRYLAPYQVPPHETVYAMTVHKSQGSEFDRVILVLPDLDVPVFTRELIYTAVTRARVSLLVLGQADMLRRGLERSVVRASGLRAALWP